MKNIGLSSERKNALAASNEAVLADLWAQFNTQFPTEEDCLEEVYRRADDAGLLKCHHCGNRDIERNYGERTFLCISCKKTSWLTAGTLFHRMKLARAWLGAIWLLEHGQSISSLRFKTLAGIAYSSALNIVKKLTMVIESEMEEDVLVVPSALFSSLIGKRSRETPARARPLGEQEEMEGQELNMSQEAQEAANLGELSEREKEVYVLLSREAIHFDDLCQHTGMKAGQLSASLMLLELSGLAERIVGDRYLRRARKHNDEFCAQVGQSSSDKEETTEPATTIKAIIEFVTVKFHRIARKYLQNYLTLYWCHTDRRRWSLGRLLQACLRFHPVTYAEILSYMSPAMVKLVSR